MAIEPPWMYSAERGDDPRFPTTPFDPKAVTRASWEPRPRRPKQEGPLLSFDRHPDAHAVLTHRSTPYKPMGPRTKKWIKRLRQMQLGLRVLELNGSIGILAMMVLLTKMDPVKSWVMRIASGLAICHCIYAIYHLVRSAVDRSPASSAAYQVFSAIADLATLSLYAFGAFTTQKESDGWSNQLPDKNLTEPFIQVAYYGMVAVGGLHLISLSLSLWLAWAFRRISLMPPDMNPLEDNLTARPKHKRNKSSVTTVASTESDKGFSTPAGNHPRVDLLYSDNSRAPTVPFAHTREGSTVSLGSRDSRGDLPSRQYQIMPGNSPRNSTTSMGPKRMSRPLSAYRGSYAEVPVNDPSTAGDNPVTRGSIDNGRAGKFTETWLPTDSLVSRTNQRNRNAAAGLRTSNRNSASYAALSQRYNMEDSSDSEYDDGNAVGDNGRGERDLSRGHHPNPLASNPLQTSRTFTNRAKTPFRSQGPAQSVEKNIHSKAANHNYGLIPQSQDIVDQTTAGLSGGRQQRKSNCSQSKSGFYSKPYGNLKSATQPIIVGGDRKISSGNDYDTSKHFPKAYGRRNVSGKVAEEGRAGNMSSKYGSYITKNF